MIVKIRETRTLQAIAIPEGTYTVGREQDNAIHIPDSSVSRHHAVLINSSEGLFIEDLGSSNGTAVRGEFITRRIHLSMGDIFFLGNISFKVEPEIAIDEEEKEQPAPSEKATAKIKNPRAEQASSAPPPRAPLPKPTGKEREAVASIQFDNTPLQVSRKEDLATGILAKTESDKKTPSSGGATLKLPEVDLARITSGKIPSPVPLPESISAPTEDPFAAESSSVANKSPAVNPLPVEPPLPSPNVEHEEEFKIPGWIWALMGALVGFILGVLAHRLFGPPF